jgi:hypothetical protein
MPIRSIASKGSRRRKMPRLIDCRRDLYRPRDQRNDHITARSSSATARLSPPSKKLSRNTATRSVFVYDGIRTTALPKGWTNRHVHVSPDEMLSPERKLNLETGSLQRLFRLESALPFLQRQQRPARAFGGTSHITPERTWSRARRWDRVRHAATDRSIQAEYIAPEAPSGYNYAQNANHSGSSDDFKKSCQIYQAPYEIESATIEFDGLGREIVKLVFDRRFDSHPDAPATVDPDPMAWSGT